MKKKEKGKEVKLEINIVATIGIITILIPLKEIAKLTKKCKQIKKSLEIWE